MVICRQFDTVCDADAEADADVAVCFKVFDCDRDGVLSVSELRHMLFAMLVVYDLNRSDTAHRLVSLHASFFLLSINAFDRLSNHFGLCLCVCLSTDRLLNCRWQFCTDFHQILHVAQKFVCFKGYFFF